MLPFTTSLGIIAARDPGSTRLVYGIVIALIALGVGLAVFAGWLVRATRPDRELLAPLEAIQSRRWRRLDPAGRRRLLDELRPAGAEPEDPAPSEPTRDDEFGDGPSIRDVRELAPVEDAGPAVSPQSDTGANGTVVVGEVGLTAPAAAPVPRAPRDWDLWDTELGLGPRPVDGGTDAAADSRTDGS